MEPKPVNEEVLNSVDESRRDFLKKVIAGTAFIVPLMASFSMEGLSAWAERDDSDDDHDIDAQTYDFSEYDEDSDEDQEEEEES